MCDSQHINAFVANEENLARVIFSPLMVEDGDLSPSAFFLRDLKPPEDYVSVFRHNYFVPDRDNISMIKPKNGNVIYGYALINAGECRLTSFKDILVDVLPHPTKNNPYHAGIHYSKSGRTIKGACADPDFIIIAGMLANKSELIAF